MFPDLSAPFHKLLSDTSALLPQLERGELLERNLLRNVALAVGLDRRASAEQVGEQLGRLISQLANPETLDSARLEALGRTAKYVTAALKMAASGVMTVPGVELQYRAGELVFPNGRTLLHMETKYHSDCPEDRGFLFDCGAGGLVTIPGYSIKEAGPALFTAEGRMLIPFRLASHFEWGIAELPSSYSPCGHSFVLKGREISTIYGLYPLSDGRIAAFVQLRSSEYDDNQLIDVAENELIEFEEPGAYIAGNLVYGTEGELFAPIRFKKAPDTDIVTLHGSLLNCVERTGLQIADVASGRILTSGIHTSGPWINSDGSVQAKIWRHKPNENDEDDASHIQTLANPRVNSIDPFNEDNFPLGCCHFGSRQRHKILTHCARQWIGLPHSPRPECHFRIEFRDRWVVTLEGAEQHILRGKGGFLPEPAEPPGPGSLRYFFTRAGDQIVQFCRSSSRRVNEYDFFDLTTGRQLMIDGTLVTAMSEPRILPDGREIWPVQLAGRGYLVCDPATRKLTGIPGIEIAYIGGGEAVVDRDNYFILACCKQEFSDQRFLKV